MKVNNKGFAYSTVLYGVLAIITVVLYAILVMSRNSQADTMYYGEKIQNTLNECVDQELDLEKCYTAGNVDCTDKLVVYHSCIGVNESDLVIKDTVAKVLREKVDTDGLKKIGNRYVYTGNTANNYARFYGKDFRIISVEENDSIKLMDTNVLNDSWDRTALADIGNNEYQWSSSSLKTHIQRYPAFEEQLLTVGWTSRYIQKSVINNISDLLAVNGDVASAKAGLLSVYDYMLAAVNDECRTGAMFTSTSCGSWLSSYGSWTIDLDNEDLCTTEGSSPRNIPCKAYYFENNSLKTYPVYESHNTYIVIYMNKNHFIASGTGTLSDPYILQ